MIRNEVFENVGGQSGSDDWLRSCREHDLQFSMSDKTSIWAELKRRNVYRVGLF